MQPGATERFVPIPDGEAGSLVTLDRMAALVRGVDPDSGEPLPDHRVVEVAAASMAAGSWSLARLFEWARAHVLYLPDYNDGQVTEEIRTAGETLREIAVVGYAIGDCDDYVVLLGALTRQLGYPVTLVAVATHDDGQLDHVYLRVETAEGPRGMDAIPVYGQLMPFGWEPPDTLVTRRLEWPV